MSINAKIIKIEKCRKIPKVPINRNWETETKQHNIKTMKYEKNKNMNKTDKLRQKNKI